MFLRISLISMGFACFIALLKSFVKLILDIFEMFWFANKITVGRGPYKLFNNIDFYINKMLGNGKGSRN